MLGDYWQTKELAIDRQKDLLHENDSRQGIVSKISMTTIGLLLILSFII